MKRDRDLRRAIDLRRNDDLRWRWLICSTCTIREERVVEMADLFEEMKILGELLNFDEQISDESVISKEKKRMRRKTRESFWVK